MNCLGSIRIGFGACSLLAAASFALSCSVLDDARVRISFGSELPEVDDGGLIIRFSDGASERVLRGADLSPDPAGTSVSRRYETRHSGSLTVDVLLEGADGKTIAAGRVVLPLREDWEWGVNVVVSDRNPSTGCFGCFGVVAFPLDAAVARSTADSLFIVWGGNYISNPVIY